MTKTFVLDTSVLLHDGSCLSKFEEHQIILPITSIEEMDTKKKDQREIGRNARQIARFIESVMSDGNLRSGVVVNEKGGTLRVSLPSDERWILGDDFDKTVNDNKILNTAAFHSAILVSNDTNLRIKAEACGLKSETYFNDKIDTGDQYSGTCVIDVNFNEIENIYETGSMPAPYNLFPNQCALVREITNNKHSALTRYNSVSKELILLPQDSKIMDILPRNKEQQFALDILMDPSIKLVTLQGLAGSGKSMIALLAGLHHVLNLKTHKKLLVYRPLVPMGNDIGYLPGEMSEKLAPWMQPIVDNIDFIMGDLRDKEETVSKKLTKKQEMALTEKAPGRISATQELISYQLLEMGALTYIRGRSIPGQYLIVDEAQNCSIHEIKTIITRVGEGTKIILTGDPSQIDTPYLDSENNGLTYVAERFKLEPIAGHITFTKSERSELAEIAARIL